jgi:hypothetical protein
VPSSKAKDVDGVKEGETWEYSTDGGATFKSSTVGSFTLNDDTYVAGAIQINKLDAAGDLLGVTKINETSKIASCIKFLNMNGTSNISANIQCKPPDCARLKGSTTISGILPSFAFFQTIDNNRIIVGNAIVI